MKVASATWEKYGERTVIKAFDGKMNSRTIFPKIKPYCFSLAKQTALLSDVPIPSMNIHDGDYVNISGEHCMMLDVGWPTHIYKKVYDRLDPNCLMGHAERLALQTYEADLPFVRRWMMDENIETELNSRQLFWDIEVDCREGLPLPDNAKYRIISMAGVTNEGEEMTFCDDSEENIINDFFAEAKKFPVIIGFNSKKYDKPYLMERAGLCGFHYPYKNHQWLDMMELYKKSEWGLYASNTLDDIAHRELSKCTLNQHPDTCKLKAGYIECKKCPSWHEESKTFTISEAGGAQALWDMFEHNRPRLTEYNLHDAVILKLLEDKLSLIMTKTEQAALAGVLVGDASYVSRLVDTLLMKRYMVKHPRIVVNNRIAVRRDTPSFKGATVYEPVRGIHTLILSFDYAGLYSSIIKVWNMGIDTLDENGDIYAEECTRYKSSPNSEAVEMLLWLSKERSKYKKLRDQFKEGEPEWLKYQVKQIGIKTILNSTYGAFGEEGARWYKKPIARSIAAQARAILAEGMEIAKGFGFEILYGDTDSFFMKKDWGNITQEQIIAKGQVLERLMNIALKRRLMEKYHIPEWRYSSEHEEFGIKLEFACLYTKIFFSGQKKKYIAKSHPAFKGKASIREVLTSSGFVDPNTTIVGFEMKKYDTMLVMKKLQEKIFGIIFKDNMTMDQILSESKYVLANTISDIFAGRLDEELIQRKGVRKPLDQYPKPTLHVNVARTLQELGMFRPGDVVQYLVISEDDGKKYAVPVYKGSTHPPITKTGYQYYERRLCDAVSRMFEEKVNIKDHLLADYS